MPNTVDATLESLLDDYLKNWGPVRWRDLLATAAPPSNPALGNILLSISAVEADSRVAYRKLQAAGLDRRPSIRGFGIAWVAEEAEHSRAIAQLARMLGSTASIPKERHSFSITAWPAVVGARSFRALVEPVYLVIGAAAEYLALITYKEVAKHIDDLNAAQVLHLIAAQEGRHLRFYRRAAIAILEDKPHSLLIPMILKHYWEPVGTNVLGAEAWFAAFADLLTNNGYRDRVVRIDEIIQSIPGLSELSLMRPILLKHGYSVPAVRERRGAPKSDDPLAELLV
jgi:rubrerythrin